jgi:branched-chain amino acid transport system ATP-binding protein
MLRVAGVSAGYGDLIVLRGVDLEVRQGELVALVGSNAAGKTTLLRAIMRLLPLASGRVEFEDRALSGMATYEVAQSGMSLVREQSVLKGLSVHDNLLLGAYRKPARGRVSESMESVFKLFPVLAERRQQIASSLSGGEQQMLCIGRAMMGRPRLLLLDEPSMGLAPTMVSVILKALAELNRQGLTILLVEQNVAQTLRVASRAYVLEGGKIVLTGAAADLLQNPQVKSAYLGL